MECMGGSWGGLQGRGGVPRTHPAPGHAATIGVVTRGGGMGLSAWLSWGGERFMGERFVGVLKGVGSAFSAACVCEHAPVPLHAAGSACPAAGHRSSMAVAWRRGAGVQALWERDSCSVHVLVGAKESAWESAWEGQGPSLSHSNPMILRPAI
jgi:hypothetical protein